MKCAKVGNVLFKFPWWNARSKLRDNLVTFEMVIEMNLPWAHRKLLQVPLSQPQRGWFSPTALPVISKSLYNSELFQCGQGLELE